MTIEVGSILEGVVTGITNFGAFVELPEGNVGLVHISEVAEEFVRDVHDFLKEHDKVKVKVLSVDQRGKIGLSIKQAIEKKNPDVKSFKPAPKPNNFRKPVNNSSRNTSASFEDKLSKFLKDSDERLTDLRRKTDAKRGGRGGGRS